MNNGLTRFAVGTTALLLAALSARADVLTYEGFDYAPGSDLSTVGAGGFGWAGPWQDVNGNGMVRVEAGNLVPPGAAAGLALFGQRGFCPSTDRAGRFLDTSPSGPFGVRGFLDSSGRIGADGKRLYVSFLQQADGTTYFYEFEFHRGDVGDPGRIGGIGNDVSGSVNVNLRAPNGTHTPIGAGNTNVNFWVVRVDFKAGNDDVRVYRNPPLGSEPATPTLTRLAAADMAFDGLAFAAFVNNRTVAVDEIRLGETYADVTPLPLAPAIVAQPQSVTNSEGAAAVFSILATPSYNVSFQWRRNGANLLGATRSDYGLSPIALSDNGALFDCVVTNAAGAVTSRVATLAVTNDTAPPAILSISTPGVGSIVVIGFSEPLAAAAATNATNYSISPGVAVLSAAFGSDNRTVVLTASPLARGATYTLTVRNLRDLAAVPNTIASNTQREFTASATPLAISFLKPPPESLGPSSRRTPLVISEIMFHPTSRPDGRNLEFVELFNSQIFSEDISGCRLSGSIDFTFPSNTVMPARGFLVVAASPADIRAAYGLGSVLGPWTQTNGLPNSAGTVRLRNAQDALLLEVNYSGDPPWPLAADGAGHSLVLARPSLGEGDPRAWAASDALGGSPGGDETRTAVPGGLEAVLINEFLANSDPPQLDFIELFNYSTQAVNLAGCSLSDEVGTNKWTFPAGVIQPCGFVSLDESQLGFALGSGGEQIVLRAPDGRVLDGRRFGAQGRGISSGRVPDGATGFLPLRNPTPGAANASARVASVIFSEIMYAPVSGDTGDEFIELCNRGTNAADLGGWRLRGGISFDLPSGTTLSPGAYLIVARDRARLMADHASLSGENTLGNFSGGLGNSGDHLQLLRPEASISSDGIRFATNTIYVLENEFTYGTGGRWGRWSHAGGSSLELVDLRSDNQVAPNWADSDETSKSQWVTIQNTGVLDFGISPADSLQIYLLGAGECLVDDVEVVPQGGINLLSNPGFENGANGWYFQGTHSKSSVETSGALSGSGVLRIRASDDGDPGANRIRSSLAASLSSGQTVTLRARVRWLRGHPEILLRLRGGWLEAAGNILTARNLGSPGFVNSVARMNAGPAIADVSHSPVLPAANQAVTVTARISDSDGLASLLLRYRLDPSSSLQNLIMEDRGAGWFSATIPGQVAGALAAFRIVARDAATPDATSLFPNDAPLRECLVRWGESVPGGALGTYRIWITQSTAATWSNREKNSNERLDATFVYGNERVIYNAGAMYSGSPFHTGGFNSPTGGLCDYRVGFPEDDLLLGVNDLRLAVPGTFGDDTTQVREQFVYWIARQLNMPFYHRRFIHVFVNGNRRGSIMEDVQQPNDDFIGQWFPGDRNGTLHKCTDWIEFDDAGQGFVGLQRATLQNFITTGGARKTACYRGMWPLRGAESMNDYTDLFTLVDTLNLPSPEPYTANTRALVDVEEWVRALVLQRIAGNFDSWGYRYGKNMFAYKPLHASWAMFPWDIDFSFNLGSLTFGDGPATDLFADNGDPVSVKMTSHPPFRRAYWRALQDAVNGPLSPHRANPRLDELYAALAKNEVNAIAPTEVKNYVSQRRDYILAQLAAVAAPFDIAPGTDFTTNRNLILLTGRAPVEVKTIQVNGLAYEPTWTTVTNWSLRLALGEGANRLSLEALDLRGQPIPGLTDSIQVTLAAPVDSPAGKVLFNEIMFDPPVAGASFVELFNASISTAFDVSGWRIDGLSYTFPAGTILVPGGFLVLARDRLTLQSIHGASLTVFDEFPGALQNHGETLTLIQPGPAPEQDLVVDRVRYEAASPWPVGASGGGSSLQLVDPAQDNRRVCNWSDSLGWRFASYTGVPAGNILYVYLEAAGEVFLDDLTLVPGAVPGVGTNYVVNGDFERPLTNGWRMVGSGTNQVTNSTVTGLARHSGTNGLHLVVTGRGGAAACFLQTIGALVRTNVHTLSFWYLPVGASNNLVTYLSSGFSPRTTLRLGGVATPGATNMGAATLPPIPPVWLNEVQPLNAGTLADRAGRYAPWVELYNEGTNAVDLGGLYLANSYTNLAQWIFPTGAIIPAGGFKVVFLDGRTDLSDSEELHASFALGATNGALALARVRSGQAEVLDYLNYSVSGPNRSYGSLIDGQPFDRREMFYPTPRGTNNGAAPPLVVFINEWMASNAGLLADPADNDAEDWFELYNPGAVSVDLAGCWLTDNLANKYQFQVPANGRYLIPPGGFLLVWADNESGQNSLDREDLHVNFKLEKDGEAIGLYAIDGALIDAVAFGPQANDLSQGHFPDGIGPICTMALPTPRSANRQPDPAAPPRLGKVTVTAGGPFSFSFTVPPATTYRVEFKDDLSAAVWTPLGPDQIGGGAVTVTDELGASTQRFYRILLSP